MGHSLNIKDTDVKVLGRTVSITTDNTFAAAEQLVDESFNPNVKYSGAFEDNSQWTINRLLKSKIDALSDGIPSDINPASTESYGIVRLASGTNDPDDYDVVTMNLFRPVYGDVENNKTRLAKLEECCEEVQEFIKKKDVPEIINIIPNTTMENDMVTQRDGETESMLSCDIKAAPGYYIKKCYGVTSDNVEYVAVPPVGPYPTKRTIIGHSPDELQHDIYIEGETERLPGQYKTITIIGDGVTQKAYPVSASSQNFEFTITPDVGYQRGPIIQQIDDFQKITVGPGGVTINFTGGTGANRDVITGVVQGTLSDDVTINTNDFYIKIVAGLKLDLQHCSVELQDANNKSLINVTPAMGIETDLHGSVKYRENLIGDITVDEDYTLKSVKVFADYDDYHKDYDVNLTGMHLSVSDIQFDFFDAVDIIQEHFTATTVAAETILQQLIDSIEGMKYGPIITLQIIAERVQTCSITYNGSNYNTTNNATQVVYGDSYSTTITPASGYKIDSVTVTMNGTPINQAWDRTTGKLTIGSVTGPVVITVNTSSNAPQTVQYNVTYQYSGLVRGNVNFGGNNGQPINVVTSGNKYNCTIVPVTDYYISSATIKTTSGGQVVASTYTNNILTSTNNITEDITVVITGGKNNFKSEFEVYGCGYDVNAAKDIITSYSDGGTVHMKITSAGPDWTIDTANIVATVYDPSIGLTFETDLTNSRMQRYIVDETAPNLSFDVTTGNGNRTINITVPDNLLYGLVVYQIPVLWNGQTKTMKIYQNISNEKGAALSPGYTASPYTMDYRSVDADPADQIIPSAYHKFPKDWEIKTEDVDGYTVDTNLMMITQTATGMTWGVNRLSGFDTDLLQLTHVNNANDSGLQPPSMSFQDPIRLQIDLTGAQDQELNLWKAYDTTSMSSYGNTTISADTNTFFIKSAITSDGQSVTNQSDTQASIDITGFGNSLHGDNKSVTVKLNNVDLTDKTVTVFYKPISLDSGVVYEMDDEHAEGILSQIVATNDESMGSRHITDPITINTSDNTVTFYLKGGLIVPSNSSQYLWTYRIKIS